jgi:meso-butanediol dehydrogenase/(S,S)-butanediol dehydrogenase/diacetyl reductase
MTAVVTGAATGIGAAVARTLSDRGFRVAVTDVDEDAVRRLASELDGAVGLRLDVTERASIEAACTEAVAQLGPLEVWVSNAGISSMTRFIDVSDDDFDRHMAVNARGVFACGQVSARAFIDHGAGGAIVNVASMAGKRGAVPYLAPYVASKFATVGLTQAMAFELAPHGIRVNSVCPGYVATGMQARELAWEAQLRGMGLEDVRELYLADTPLRRIETPEDVAGAVAFLASDDGSFITGEALAVNGGAFMD